MVIAKTSYLMYMLNVQVTAYGRQTVPDRGVVRSCDPLNILGAPIISLERLNLKSSNFVQRLAISILATGWHITNKTVWLRSRACFKILPFAVMRRFARVCQRQLSYLHGCVDNQSDSSFTVCCNTTKEQNPIVLTLDKNTFLKYRKWQRCNCGRLVDVKYYLSSSHSVSV